MPPAHPPVSRSVQLLLDLPALERPAPEPHTGRPLVRRTRHGRVMVLCPAGHLVQSVKDVDWPGSRLEAQVGDPGYTVTCHGAMEER
ncbi:hypothetical protein [Streptosporangium longisporum]|uniref:Uncharacterized protein n=1 Tax=Streptosporangium longisporum TaxID=46187 RepID=A0ABP6KYZ2_9ACTN